MDPDRWRKAQLLFDGALELDESARTAFLARECGDNADLRTEVESMLAPTIGRSSWATHRMRGGSFHNPHGRARSANRLQNEPEFQDDWLGLRPARLLNH